MTLVSLSSDCTVALSFMALLFCGYFSLWELGAHALISTPSSSYFLQIGTFLYLPLTKYLM